MASQSTGIQQLLVAEKRAAEKIAESRKKKARRLKQAKEEAHAEVEAYRQVREREYKEHERRMMGSKGDTESRVEEETGIQIAKLNQRVTKNKEVALQQLLSMVADIQKEVHRNLRL